MHDPVSSDCGRSTLNRWQANHGPNALHRTTFVRGFAGAHAAGECERCRPEPGTMTQETS